MQNKSSSANSEKAATPRARRERTCIIKAEVSSEVAARLLKLCRAFDLPYPDGIAAVLEAACKIADMRGASAATPAKNSTRAKKARRTNAIR